MPADACVRRGQQGNWLLGVIGLEPARSRPIPLYFHCRLTPPPFRVVCALRSDKTDAFSGVAQREAAVHRHEPINTAVTGCELPSPRSGLSSSRRLCSTSLSEMISDRFGAPTPIFRP